MKRNSAASFMPDFTIRVVCGSDASDKALNAAGFGGYIEGDAITAYEDGRFECMVCIFDSFYDHSEEERDGFIVHEAVHCAQAWCKAIGENVPGEEEQAYMVQACYRTIKGQL